MEVPEQIKITENTPLLRVPDKVPHIVPNDQNAPLPMVPQRNNDMQSNKLHIMLQCNIIYQHIRAIPPYFVSAIHKKKTAKMEEYQHLVKGKYKE
eukprot:9436985-Ditylum_brightwellii.AAC.1